MTGLPYQLHQGDALAYMATLPNTSVDHVMTDPPYSEDVHTKIGTGKERLRDGDLSGCRTRRIRDAGFTHLTQEMREASARHFARLARRWILIFCDIESAPEWVAALTATGLDYVRTGIWVKPGAAPQFSGDRPGVGYEAIVIAHPKGRKRWNGGGHHAVWTHPIRLNRGGNNPRIHPTEKPVGLMAELVTDFTDPGDLILDPFAGSGTTGVAALKNDRRFIGSELSPEYHAVALKRLQAAHAQPRLLGAPA